MKKLRNLLLLLLSPLAIAGYDGSGNYTLPPSVPVAGQLARAAQLNTIFNDIASALTTAYHVAGTPNTNASLLSSGTLPVGRLPAFTGDCSTSAGSNSLVCVSTQGTLFTAFPQLATANAFTNTNTFSAQLSSTGNVTPGSGATSVWINGGNNGEIAQVNSVATTNTKIWDRIVDSAGVLHERLTNDAFSSANDWMSVTRTGITTAITAFPLGSLISTGNSAVSVASNQVVLNGANSAQIMQVNSSAAANARVWDSYADTAGVLHMRVDNDASNSALDWAQVTRTGITSAQVGFYEPGYGVASQAQAATSSIGTFSATLSGMTSATSGTVQYRRVGPMVFLYVVGAITGTSNTTSLSITNLPAALQPANTINASPTGVVIDNALDKASNITIWGSGTGNAGRIDFGLLSGGSYGGAFTASGSKGLDVGWSTTYVLN